MPSLRGWVHYTNEPLLDKSDKRGRTRKNADKITVGSGECWSTGVKKPRPWLKVAGIESAPTDAAKIVFSRLCPLSLGRCAKCLSAGRLNARKPEYRMQCALFDRAVAVMRNGDGTPACVRPLEMRTNGFHHPEPVRLEYALDFIGGHRFHGVAAPVQSKSMSSATSARLRSNSGIVSASVKQFSYPRTVAQ